MDEHVKYESREDIDNKGCISDNELVRKFHVL